MMDWTEILDTLIKVGIPALITIITGKKLKRQANKHSARQSILQLIIEDHVRVMEHKLPENYQAILAEFDEYQSNGGNSYCEKKVSDYLKWYEKIVEKGGKQ